MTQKTKKRKFYSSAEKVAILRRHLLDHEPVSQICETFGMAPNMFYRWQKSFFEQGSSAFEPMGPKPNERKKEQRIEALEAKLRTKNEVLSELMEEHMLLKKSLGEL